MRGYCTSDQRVPQNDLFLGMPSPAWKLVFLRSNGYPTDLRHGAGPSQVIQQARHADATISPLLLNMLRNSVIFLVIAIIAAALGFGGGSSTASSIAQIIFFLFLVLFVGSLILGHTMLSKK